MFEKFTGRARRVLTLSQEEARMLNHDSIGGEHLLLGLIREDEGVGAHVLKGLGLTLEDVRRQVEESRGRGQAPTPGYLPFTASANQVLQTAHQESVQRGLDHVGTEHLLLGLVRDGANAGAQALVKLGADLERVGRTVNELVQREAAGPSAS
ncbi:Clp protease N-terminal domain-containing protein [Nonomuraea sp. SBT364]|uniref:Clp protease N-terminal domain-containing protein n=1 Tax=Nonomuraea sp. SBT364 TaxID=1580530 RepID=UPI00066D6A75|nr:Clp protease N-terminal domain-containing protein [Nonomuraea sp. SBT364]